MLDDETALSIFDNAVIMLFGEYMTQSDYWNSVADSVEFTLPLNYGNFSKFVDKGDLIVDLGCGYGRTVNDLYCLGYNRVIGIDISQKMIERGKNQFPFLDLRFSQNGICDIKADSVDAVLLFGVLSSTPFEREQKILIGEVDRILKKGGIVYVSDSLIAKDLRNAMRYKKFEDKYNCYGIFENDDGGAFRHYTEENINLLFSRYENLFFEKVKSKGSDGYITNEFYAFYKK